MKLVGYSSGAWPCGIADYHSKVVKGLRAVAVQCDTIKLPADTVYRDRPLALLERRRHYQRLAARSQGYDASILDLLTSWNGTRAGENTLPTFINHLRGPLFMIVHEWPGGLDPEPPMTVSPRHVVSRLTSLASQFGERSGMTYDDWVQRKLFFRAGHILVHARALRDKLLSIGVPPERVTFETHPVPELVDNADPAVVDALATRYAGRRKVVIFGFPHPRKALELAVQALPRLPPDVVLLFIGGVDGEFRQKYVKSLEQLAATLGVRDRVEFVGEIPETSLRAIFSLAEFALAPFAYATGSGSFSYLMRAGVPIVATDLAEHQALVDDGAGILLFTKGDLAALTSAAHTLLNDSGQRQALAAKNVAFAKRYTYPNLAARIKDRLDEMVA